MPVKACSSCGEVKDWSAFYLHKGKPNGFCKPCQSALKKRRYAESTELREKVQARSAAHYAANKERHQANQRAWAEANKERIAIKTREATLRRKYGISLERYDDLLAQQDGVCAVCLGPPKHGWKHFCVDHDHVTGRVRGLLCDFCNRAVGSLEDDADRAERLAAYLRR